MLSDLIRYGKELLFNTINYLKGNNQRYHFRRILSVPFNSIPNKPVNWVIYVSGFKKHALRFNQYEKMPEFLLHANIESREINYITKGKKLIHCEIEGYDLLAHIKNTNSENLKNKATRITKQTSKIHLKQHQKTHE